MKKETTNNFSMRSGNFKGHDTHKVIPRKKFIHDDEDMDDDNENYSMIDEDDVYIEPKGPKKEDLKTTFFFLDDDDDDDDDLY